MSKRSLEEDIHKKFLRLRYNIEGLCRKYERMSKEEDASLELNCTTGEWVQVVKPGKKPLNDVQVKDKLRELDFTKDLVCSSASVGNITDERVKVRVLKHNKRFERYYEKAKEGDNDSEDDENDYFCSQFDDDDNEMTPQLPNIDFSNSEAEEEDSCDEIEEEDKENEPKTSKNKNDKNNESDEEENEDGTEKEIVIPIGNGNSKKSKFSPYAVPVRKSPRVKKPVKYF